MTGSTPNSRRTVARSVRSARRRDASSCRRGSVPRQAGLRRRVPIEFGGEARFGPLRERVGLVETDVGHGIVEPQWFAPVECELVPAVVASPGQRPGDLVLRAPYPAITQPDHRIPVPAVLDELEPIPIRHQPVRDFEVAHDLLVTRALAVECEALPGVRSRLFHPEPVPSLIDCWRHGGAGSSLNDGSKALDPSVCLMSIRSSS